MSEIAQLTFNSYVLLQPLPPSLTAAFQRLSALRSNNATFPSSSEFYEIMDMIDKRLNDKGKNWRHVLKALKVLDYSLHEGSELVVTWAKQNLFVIKTLREFQYIDEDGMDVGQNGRFGHGAHNRSAC